LSAISTIPIAPSTIRERAATTALACGTWRSTGCDIEAGTFPAASRVRSLTPELSKGLEFDLVVLIDPEAFGEGIKGAVDRYVAMTRATQQLVILTSS
jgi:superfamily I DNA/RNA helicase